MFEKVCSDYNFTPKNDNMMMFNDMAQGVINLLNRTEFNEKCPDCLAHHNGHHECFGVAVPSIKLFFETMKQYIRDRGIQIGIK